MPTAHPRALRGHLVSVDRGSRLVMDQTADAGIRIAEGDLFRLIDVAREAGFTVTGIDYATDGDTFELLGDLSGRFGELTEERTADEIADLLADHDVRLTGVQFSRGDADALVKFDGTISGTSEEFLAVVIPIWWERTRHLPPRLLATTRGIIGLVPWDAAGVPGGYKPVAVNATAMLKLAARARSYGYTTITLRSTARSAFPVDAELNRLVRAGRLRKARRFLSAHGAHITGIDLTDIRGERTELSAGGTLSSHDRAAFDDLVVPWWRSERRTPLSRFASDRWCASPRARRRDDRGRARRSGSPRRPCSRSPSHRSASMDRTRGGGSGDLRRRPPTGGRPPSTRSPTRCR